MKKILATLWVLALIVGASSCKKEFPEPEPGTTPSTDTTVPPSMDSVAYPVYHEGQYSPDMKVISITENGTVSEEWTWDGDKLDHITYNGNQSGIARFHYEGDYITSVKGGAGQQELYYTYVEDKMTRIEVVEGDSLMMQANLSHSSNGKINGATLLVSDDYLRAIISVMTGLGKNAGQPSHASLRRVARTAKTVAKGNDPKFDITGNTISMAYTWKGENVASEILNASIDIKLTQEEYESLRDMLSLSDQYRMIADMVVASQGGLPLRITMKDTVTYTYDNRINPMFCFWGTMISADILSVSNILTATTTGSYSVAAVIMGQEVSLLNNPMDDYEEFSYEYNSKYYPTKKTGGENTTEYSYQ